MIKKAKIEESDISLFRETVGTVRPLILTKTEKLPPQSTFKRRKTTVEAQASPFYDHEHKEPVDSEALLEFKIAGVQHKILRKMRNGQYNVQASCDLHGQTAMQAKESLYGFIMHCRSQHLRLVLVVHGKGLDRATPVLKNKVNAWLRQTDEVIAFCSAAAKHGGAGALYVLLKDQNGR
jgi:DNA-nicking Smr family endonuclease